MHFRENRVAIRVPEKIDRFNKENTTRRLWNWNWNNVNLLLYQSRLPAPWLAPLQVSHLLWHREGVYPKWKARFPSILPDRRGMGNPRIKQNPIRDSRPSGLSVPVPEIDINLPQRRTYANTDRKGIGNDDARIIEMDDGVKIKNRTKGWDKIGGKVGRKLVEWKEKQRGVKLIFLG